MDLLELNSKILSRKRVEVTPAEFTDDDVKLFTELIGTSPQMLNVFQGVEDSSIFYKTYPDMRKIFGTAKSVEMFYAIKSGSYVKGVPAKLVYIIDKMFKEYDKGFINCAINAAVPLLAPYASDVYIVGDTKHKLRTLLEGAVGRDIKLITDECRKVDYDDYSEVYIPDVKRVAVLPKDIADAITLPDCEKLNYNPKLGVCLADIPLRGFNGRLGITTDDFDLRECI